MDFKTIDGEGIEIIKDALAKTSYNGCEYSYAYECAWLTRDPNCLKYAVEDGIVFIAFSCLKLPISSGEIVFLPPLAPMTKVISGYDKLREYSRETGAEFKVISAPREHVALLDPEIYIFDKSEDYSEYLYSPESLTELSGKKYHAKRNHIAKFKKLYDYTFRAYEAADYTDVMKLFDIWQSNKEDGASSEREVHAIKSMLGNIVSLGLKAAVLYVGAEIVGFTLGEITSNNVGIVHFEKANIEYEGAYSAINNFFASEFLRGARIINRQEDMGIEGLRKAKMSYYPIGFQEKWLIRSVR